MMEISRGVKLRGNPVDLIFFNQMDLERMCLNSDTIMSRIDGGFSVFEHCS